MARALQRPEFWASVVAEAQAGEQNLEQIAAKHGVTAAALKYHFYKGRRKGAKGVKARAPRVLPVRVKTAGGSLEAQFGSVRLSFRDDCDPAYVAAVLGALGKC
jgi:hypothetical protein